MYVHLKIGPLLTIRRSISVPVYIFKAYFDMVQSEGRKNANKLGSLLSSVSRILPKILTLSKTFGQWGHWMRHCGPENLKFKFYHNVQNNWRPLTNLILVSIRTMPYFSQNIIDFPRIKVQSTNFTLLKIKISSWPRHRQ